MSYEITISEEQRQIILAALDCCRDGQEEIELLKMMFGDLPSEQALGFEHHDLTL